MTLPPELKPQRRERFIDLVEKAGLDVSDWVNYERGKDRPGANPKYCYEWVLKESGRLVVCNLWYKSMKEIAGSVEQHLVLRDTHSYRETDPTRRARRARMEAAIAEAFRDGLPIRVIVLDGKSRGSGPNGKTKVIARSLDPVPWAAVSFDAGSGAIVLRRGAPALRFADQFSLPPPPNGNASSRQGAVTIRSRNADVREYVLRRANGHCEYCDERGFVLPDGSIFLETHHVIPLSASGLDSVNNVVALCPNHHRQAHYGRNAEEIGATLAAKLQAPRE